MSLKITTIEIDVNKYAQAEFCKITRWLRDNIGPGVVETTDAWSDPTIVWSGWCKIGWNRCYWVFEFKNKQDALQFQLTFG